jgi:hypothetical protein
MENYRNPNRTVFHPLNALGLVGFFHETPQFHILDFRASLLKTCDDLIDQHNGITRKGAVKASLALSFLCDAVSARSLEWKSLAPRDVAQQTCCSPFLHHLTLHYSHMMHICPTPARYMPYMHTDEVDTWTW